MSELATERPRPLDTPGSDQPKPKRRRGQGQRGPRPTDGAPDGRPPRPRGDRPPMAGWGDGIERCICAAMSTCPPRSYPVQHRTGIATIPPAVVERRPERILLCDSQHDGPHIWPDNELSAADAR